VPLLVQYIDMTALRMRSQTNLPFSRRLAHCGCATVTTTNICENYHPRWQEW